MSPSDPTQDSLDSTLALDSELLVAQSGWVQSLARSLVRDPYGAEDVAQETLLAALAAPPRDARDAARLRAWLGRVAFNTAHMATRRSIRRTSREERVAREEPVESVAEVSSRDEGTRLIGTAVASLDEAERIVVQMRYFQGLTTLEIAAKIGSTDNAVRKRLWRARGRLRAVLDARHGGDRQAWFRLLAPIAGISPRMVAPEAGVTSSLAPGGPLSRLAPLESWAWWGAAAAGLLSLAVFVPEQIPLDFAVASAPDLPTTDRRPAMLLDGGEQGSEPGQGWLDQGTPGRSSSRTLLRWEEPARTRGHDQPEAPARGLGVGGLVLDPFGRALAGAPIVDSAAADQVLGWSGLDGAFQVEIPSSPAALGVAAGEFSTLLTAQASAASDGAEHVIVAAPSVEIAGYAIDELRRPVPGARVAVEVQGALFAGFPASLERSMGVTYEAIADARGAFSFASLPTWSGLELVASKAGHVAARAGVPLASRFDLELVLVGDGASLAEAAVPEADGHLRGELVDSNGKALRGWIVSAIPVDRAAECRAEIEEEPLCDGEQGMGRDADDPPSWVTVRRNDSGRNAAGARSDEDGAFDVGGLDPGVAYEAFAYDPDSLASVTSAPVEPGSEVLVLELPSGHGCGHLAGFVRTRDGVAVAGAWVRLALAVPGPNGPQVVFGAGALAGDDGSFVLERRPGLALFIERSGVSAGFHAADDDDGDDTIVCTVDRSAAFLARIDAFAERAGSIALVDRVGRELPLVCLGQVARRLDLHRGWTIPFSVDEDAAAAVVYDENGEIDAEIPLEDFIGPLVPLGAGVLH